MNLPTRFTGIPNFNDIKDYLFLAPLFLSGLQFLHRLWQKWGTLKFISVFCCIGEVVVGSVLVYVCLDATVSIFRYTGFLWPFFTPTIVSPAHLSSVEASIFGSFTSFFTLGLMGAGTSIVVAIFGLKKLLKKKFSGYSCYQ